MFTTFFLFLHLSRQTTVKSVDATFEKAKGNYILANYIDSHLISNTYFEFGSNGDKSGYPITNILTSDNTYWVSDQPCSDSFRPTITYNFTKTVTLEAFLFNPAYRTSTIRNFDGFPLKLNIYASLNNGPFELKVVFSGETPTDTSWDTTQFVFPTPLQCDKLKLEFVTVTPSNSHNSNGATVATVRRIRLLGEIYVNNLISTGTQNPYDSNEYVTARKISTDDFTYTCSGSQGNLPISYAFDDISTTYWVSLLENNDTFKNYIEIEFNEVKTIEGFLYDTAYRTRYPSTGTVRYFDGFPTKLKAYSSPTTNDPYVLDSIFEGNPVYPMARIQFIFNKPIQVRKLKLEFDNVTLDESFTKTKYCVVTGGITFLKYIYIPPPTSTPTASPMATPTASPLPAHLDMTIEKASGDYTNTNYVNQHKISNDLFEVSSNGDKSGYPLSNAFDGKADTFWVSGTENSDSFKATVTFNFKRTVLLEAFLFNPAYHTRPPIRYQDGFPLKVNFYASINDAPFQLVSSFSGENPTETSWDLTQFVFYEPIRCNKIQVEFVEVTPNDSFSLGNKTQTAAAEMKFIGSVSPDYLAPAATSGSYDTPQYVTSHRVSIEEITFSSNGDKSGYPLSNAFDRVANTYWVSGTENSDTFKSTITIEFKQSKTVDAILLDTAYRTRYPSTGTVRYFDGFPTVLNVYTASSTDDDFVLSTVFVGEPVFPWMRVQFVFKSPIECRRLKLEYINVTEDGSFSNGKHCATAAEIYILTTNEQPPDPTASPKPTSTPTKSPMATPTASQSPTPMATQSPTASISQSPMPTPTPMATPTATPMATPTASPSPNPFDMTFEKGSGDYANNNYVNEHKISNNYYEVSSNGDKSGYPLSNAFDGKADTFWVSGTENSDSFKATVTFNFKRTVLLEAFLFNPAYHTRPPIRYQDGFPLRLNFYISNNDSPFELATSFSGEKPTSTSWDLTQFVFALPIRCDKIKVEFAEVTPNDSFGLGNKTQAAAAEMKFIGEIEPDFIESKGTEGIYNLSDYTTSHIISTEDFEYSSNGDKDGKPIANAFDGSPSTYWVAGEENSDTFKSAITIQFKKTTNVDAILIDPAYRTRYPETGTVRYFDGFPTTLNVYASTTTGDSFKLDTVFKGEPHYPWAQIQFVFKTPIKCRRLKLEFSNVTLDESFWNTKYAAVVGEITLLQDAAKPPPLPNEDGVIIPEAGECNHKYRCDQNITDDKTVTLEIKQTNFSHYNNEKDGGAISLINCGFECEKTEFNECTSTKGGGAIFYSNEKLNGILNLIDITFVSCSAVFGGAAYVCSPTAPVYIVNCNFNDLHLLEPGENAGEYHGGSALFLSFEYGSVRNNNIKRCDGTAIKVHPRFDYKPSSFFFFKSTKASQKVVTIERCTFEANEKTDASIYFIRGSNAGTSFNIVQCDFIGTLKEGSHFIDGRSISNKSPKLFVTKCKFASSSKNAINMNSYDEFLSIDLKDQVFNEDSIVEEESMYNWKSILIIVSPAALIIIVTLIVVLIVVKKRKNTNTFDEVEMSVETTQDFYQSNLNINQDSLNQSLI
ncbi:hypothetical protein M9Y10_001583 [Tritrichomonas musculus]|uniref:F5/8 type C domain-containing protein n=1 Tax=Tritrichomonas musculus TaxID=1915356 RepID=A0ABR2L7F0_9EUKA